MAENSMKPRIRFKGYTDAWEQRKVNEVVASVDTGRSHFQAKMSGKYEILGSTAVIGYDDEFDYQGEFLLTARVGANAGTLYRHSGKVKISDNTVFLQGNNLDFMYYALSNYDLKKLSFGTGQPLVKASELKKLSLILPSGEKEKKYVGRFFEQIDNLITLHQRKYDKIVNIKRALLEKMFPSDAETTPKIRFRGFTDAWEQRKLGDTIDFYSGLTYSPSDIVKDDGVFVLRSCNVQEGEIVDEDNVYVRAGAVNSDNVRVGDIIVVVRNGSRSLIGKHAKIKKNMPKTVIGAFMTGLRYKNSAYLNAVLNTSIFEREIEKDLGATINQITTGAFRKMVFPFPKQPEQLLIGNFFEQLDNLITLHQRQLEKLKNIKSALLEKMFV